MPKKYGVKEKDLVVAHVVNLILTGKLRSGDRVDRNEIAHELGVSRVPIQEAVVQLEHDGILSTRYHRGAFVELFDESVVREHHEVYGMLSGIASARAAEVQDPEHLRQLESFLNIDAHQRRFTRLPGSGLAVPRPDQRGVLGPTSARRHPGVAVVHAAGLLDGTTSTITRTCCSSSRLSSTPCAVATARPRAPPTGGGPR